MSLKKEFKLEETIKKIENIVTQLENGDANLEELVQYYSDGIKLIDEAQGYLEKTEQRIIEISGKNI